jgi:hypothetical protein
MLRASWRWQPHVLAVVAAITLRRPVRRVMARRTLPRGPPPPITEQRAAVTSTARRALLAATGAHLALRDVAKSILLARTLPAQIVGRVRQIAVVAPFPLMRDALFPSAEPTALLSASMRRATLANLDALTVLRSRPRRSRAKSASPPVRFSRNTHRSLSASEARMTRSDHHAVRLRQRPHQRSVSSRVATVRPITVCPFATALPRNIRLHN